MNNSPPRNTRPPTPNQPPPVVRRQGPRRNVNGNVVRRELNYEYVPRGRRNGIEYTNEDRENVNRIAYNNLKMPKNVVNMVTHKPFNVGNRVIRYANGKYMKMKDFAMYLQTPKAGRKTLGEFLDSNGNRKFLSPESIRFRRADVKFYRFT